VLEIAQRNLVTIYAISTDAYGFGSDATRTSRAWRADRRTRRISSHSLYKDVSRYLSTPSDEGNLRFKVAPRLRRRKSQGNFQLHRRHRRRESPPQYILRYIPEVEDKTTRRVFREIKVSVNNLPNVKVRARTGYYPPTPDTSQVLVVNPIRATWTVL